MGAIRWTVAVIALAATVACGSDNAESTDQTEVSVAVAPNVGEDGGAPNPASARGAAGACTGTVPGEVMTAAQAHVRFTVERICPGYVTITPGMSVQFTNDGDAAATVTLASPDAPDTAVWSTELDPGETDERAFPEVTVAQYTVTMIPTFTGVIEVRDPETAEN